MDNRPEPIGDRVADGADRTALSKRLRKIFRDWRTSIGRPLHGGHRFMDMGLYYRAHDMVLHPYQMSPEMLFYLVEQNTLFPGAGPYATEFYSKPIIGIITDHYRYAQNLREFHSKPFFQNLKQDKIFAMYAASDLKDGVNQVVNSIVRGGDPEMLVYWESSLINPIAKCVAAFVLKDSLADEMGNLVRKRYGKRAYALHRKNPAMSLAVEGIGFSDLKDLFGEDQESGKSDNTSHGSSPTASSTKNLPPPPIFNPDV